MHSTTEVHLRFVEPPHVRRYPSDYIQQYPAQHLTSRKMKELRDEQGNGLQVDIIEKYGETQMILGTLIF